MGILKHLLFWPVTGPSYLARFSLEKVQGVVKEQLTDDTPVKEALLDLQLRMELGEIDDDEYEAEEARIMSQLREVRHWREEFGMATRGGVVRVADEGSERSESEEPSPGDAGEGSPAAGSEEREEARPAFVPAGATLEISLDWDTDEEPLPSGARDDEDDGEDDGEEGR